MQVNKIESLAFGYIGARLLQTLIYYERHFKFTEIGYDHRPVKAKYNKEKCSQVAFAYTKEKLFSTTLAKIVS